MPLHDSSTMCSSSGGQNCIIQHLVLSHRNEWSKITKIQFYKYERIVVNTCVNFSGVITVYYLL